MSRKLVNIVFALLILIVSALFAKALIDTREPLHSKPRQSEGPLVEVYTIERSGAALSLNSHGTVQAKTALQLTSDVAGRITWVNPDFTGGVILAAGTPIVRVDKTQYELAVAQATLTLRDAELALTDAHTRFKTRNPRHIQIRRAEAQVSVANAQIKKAEADLKRTEVTLPVQALVATKQIALGQYVMPGNVLANLQAVAIVEIALPISQAELELLRTAQSPSVRLSSVDGKRNTHWQARLARVNQQLDPTTHVAYAVAEVEEPYEQSPPLRIGQFVEANIHGITIDDVFRLPTTTIFENRFVYRLIEDNRLQRIDVDILRQDTRSVVARGNLATGDRLVSSRLDIMSDGMQVRVDNKQ